MAENTINNEINNVVGNTVDSTANNTVENINEDIEKKKKETQYFLVDIDELTPYINNARTHDERQIAQIAASIKEFGFLTPIVIAEDNTILCGHGRYYAAQKLGLKKIPCIKEEYLTEAQKKAYIIADNKISLNAGWDEELLKVELDELRGDAFNLSLMGFSEEELENLFIDEENPEVKEDKFDLTEALEEASFVERGDIWTVGKHRLMCGDATSAIDVEKLMDGKKADLVITDPPYNANYTSSLGLSIQNDNLTNDDFCTMLCDAFINMGEYLREGGVAYAFYAAMEQPNLQKAFQDAGLYCAECLVWVKNAFTLGRQDYQWRHEPILYGWKDGASHYFTKDRTQSTVFIDDEINFRAMKKNELVNYIEELRKEYFKNTTVIEEDKPFRNDIHPTMKPLGLIAKLIENSSKPEWLVLDTFGGSGSTMMACEQAGRICYMMELDEKYASAILRRYVEDTGDTDEVYVERNGEKIMYKDIAIELKKR